MCLSPWGHTPHLNEWKSISPSSTVCKPKGRNCTRQRNWLLSFRVTHHRRLCLRGKRPRNIQGKKHCLMEALGDQISKSSCDTLKSVNCNVWASPVAQMVKNPPAMWETWVRSRGCEDSLEEGMATHSSILAWRILMDRGAWWAAVHGVAESWTWLSD